MRREATEPADILKNNVRAADLRSILPLTAGGGGGRRIGRRKLLMDDLAYGKRNKRGDWTPSATLAIAPVFVLPPRPLAFLKWLPGYFLPWNLLFATSAVAYAYFVLPDVEVMKTLAWGWILRLFLVNCVAVFLFYSALEYRLYMSRAQGNRFKSHSKCPNDQKKGTCVFRSQNIEGIIRGFGTGVPIWTAY